MNANYVSKSAQIASILEVSGYPKPGNVHRTKDFDDMCFEDFLISGIVIGDVMYEAAKRSKKCRDLKSIELGYLIYKAVKETKKWVNNNTNLGIIMLLTPLSAAAGMSKRFGEIRENVDKIMRNTTPKDSVYLYRAIRMANAGGMGNHEIDVTDKSSESKLLKNNLNMFDVLKISSSWDNIANELTNAMPITFDIGFPTFKKNLKYGINIATVQTFLVILSKFPDTLIRRKYGHKTAVKVSEAAKDILDVGGMLSNEGYKKIKHLDKKLREKNLNPGTTADLTAASIMVTLLDMYDKTSNSPKCILKEGANGLQNR